MLVERLMGLNDDGTEPNGPLDLKIPVHSFFAAMVEVAASRMTPAQLKAIFWRQNSVPLRTTPNDVGELTNIVATMPAAGTVARALFIGSIHSIFILAEERITGYDTPALVRAKLGI